MSYACRLAVFLKLLQAADEWLR